jgi:hypothetical protein
MESLPMIILLLDGFVGCPLQREEVDEAGTTAVD